MDPSDHEASAAANAYAMGIATEIQDPANPPPEVLSPNNVTEAESLLEVTEANAVNMHSISVAPLDTVAYQEVYYEEVLTTSPAMLVHVQFEDHTIQSPHNEYTTIQTMENSIQTEHISVQVQEGTIEPEDNSLHTLGNLVQTQENGMQAEDYIQAAENLLQTEEIIMQTEYSTMESKDSVLQTENNPMQIADNSVHVEDSTMHDTVQIQDNEIHDTVTMEGHTVQLQEHATQLENRATQLQDNAAHLEHNSTQLEGYATHLEGNSLPMTEHVILIPKGSPVQAEGNAVQAVYNQVPIVDNAIHIEGNMVHLVDNTVHIEDHTVHIEDHTVHIEDNTIQIEDNTIQTVDTEINSVDMDDAELTVESEVQKKRKLPVSADGEPMPKRKRGRKKKVLSVVGGVSEDISLPSEALTDPDVELGVVKPKKKASQASKTDVSDLSALSLDTDIPNSEQALAQDEASEDPTTAELALKEVDPVTPPPVKVYKKRGRKSKAEMLMIKLAQGLEIDPPKPSYITKILEEPDVLEMTPGGRPQRRAAKAALVYLQELAAELSTAGPATAPSTKSVEEENVEPAEPSEPAEVVEPTEPDPSSPVQKKRRRRKKKADWDEDDVSQDADFVLSEELKLHENDETYDDDENDLFSDGPDPELASLKRSLGRSGLGKVRILNKGTSPNGLPNSIMTPVWKCSRVTMEHREEHHSPWEFPEWVPSSTKWTFLPDSEATEYMPQEVKSPLFTIRREGLREEGTYYRLNRFHCLLPHEERWDMTFFVGGPVWSMDWCPTPDGSAGCQYVALYCNMGMEDTHTLSGISQGPGLLQLWNLGQLQHETCYSSKASMTYGIALDNGCIWDLKFCPSGAWELPTTKRKNPQMARLGLLAVAFSSGFVEIYSLPHSESLHTYKQLQVKDPFHSKYTICKVQCVATLNVGSIQASSSGECGQCFCLAWLPSKPHQHIAAGFYDGTVAMWDLTTKSLLQRVRYADGLIKLYPFNCFSAHDHAVRCIEWCKVNSNFIATAGKDRKIKFWDLRRLYEPLNSIKRFLSTEITWVLPYSGVAVAQDNCYASYGLCGIHYLDTSCLGYKAYYVAPRKGTVWSISGSDWLNSIAAGDVTGEVIAAVLPDLTVNPTNVKRPSERRFPVYKADLLQCSALADKTSKEEQGEGSEKPDAAAVSDRSYKAAVTKYSILYQDTDLRHFKHYLNREPMKRMWNSESKGDLSMDRMQLESIHKVRFNPNLDSHGWLISGGQAGLVRVHCMKGLASHIGRKLIMECQTQFSTMYDHDMQDEAEYIPEVRHSVVQAE